MTSELVTGAGMAIDAGVNAGVSGMEIMSLWLSIVVAFVRVVEKCFVVVVVVDGGMRRTAST